MTASAPQRPGNPVHAGVVSWWPCVTRDGEMTSAFEGEKAIQFRWSSSPEVAGSGKIRGC